MENLNTNCDSIANSINENINEANSKFLQLFYSAAELMKVNKKLGLNRFFPVDKPWWDAVSETMRNRKMQALRLFRILSKWKNLRRYLTLRNIFKGVCRDKKRVYEYQNRQKLVQSRKNPYKFWKLLKGNVVNIKSKIKPMQWFNYFKELFSFDE